MNNTMVPMYGFGGGGEAGATLTVIVEAGCTVNITKGYKTYTKTAGEDRAVVFNGLSSGEWTISATNGELFGQQIVTIMRDYITSIQFFQAIIHISYPVGSICKVVLNPAVGAIIHSAGTVLGTINGRTYTKKNDGEAIYAFVYNYSYTGPMVVSTNENDIIYSCDAGDVGASGSVEYNEKTYYYTTGAWFPGNLLPYGKPCITSSFEKAALMLAEAYEDYINAWSTELTAPDASGIWDCVVHNAGMWTVTLDRGYSEKIEVTESGEYTVNKWHLYNSGNQCIGITGGWSSAIGNGANYWAYNDDCMSCSLGYISDAHSRTLTNRNINFSGFKTAYVQFSFDGSQWGIYARIGPGVLDIGLSNYPVKTVNTVPIDLSAVQSTHAFDIVIMPNTSNVKVFNVWLEV